ncbi:MAG: hypothetical protein M3040_05895 [Bacteroidota bacterium]|nr:hypothetical protein [Bacteroidota bacterium]
MQYIVIGIVFAIIGLIFGFVSPKKSWRWGLWIASPVYVLIGISVAFSGYFTAFLKYDLPIIIAAVLAACCGSFIGARLRNTWKKHNFTNKPEEGL